MVRRSVLFPTIPSLLLRRSRRSTPLNRTVLILIRMVLARQRVLVLVIITLQRKRVVLQVSIRLPSRHVTFMAIRVRNTRKVLFLLVVIASFFISTRSRLLVPLVFIRRSRRSIVVVLSSRIVNRCQPRVASRVLLLMNWRVLLISTRTRRKRTIVLLVLVGTRVILVMILTQLVVALRRPFSLTSLVFT